MVSILCWCLIAFLWPTNARPLINTRVSVLSGADLTDPTWSDISVSRSISAGTSMSTSSTVDPHWKLPTVFKNPIKKAKSIWTDKTGKFLWWVNFLMVLAGLFGFGFLLICAFFVWQCFFAKKEKKVKVVYVGKDSASSEPSSVTEAAPVKRRSRSKPKEKAKTKKSKKSKATAKARSKKRKK